MTTESERDFVDRSSGDGVRRNAADGAAAVVYRRIHLGASATLAPRGSIPGHGRIDVGAPGVDAALHALGQGKTLLTKPLRHAQAAHAVVAVDDDRLFLPGR